MNNKMEVCKSLALHEHEIQAYIQLFINVYVQKDVVHF